MIWMQNQEQVYEHVSIEVLERLATIARDRIGKIVSRWRAVLRIATQISTKCSACFGQITLPKVRIVSSEQQSNSSQL